MDAKKQTAVDWVFEYLWKNHHLSFSDSTLMKAKAMEKEQIIEAYYYDPNSDEIKDDGEQYYNETYEK